MERTETRNNRIFAQLDMCTDCPTHELCDGKLANNNIDGYGSRDPDIIVVTDTPVTAGDKTIQDTVSIYNLMRSYLRSVGITDNIRVTSALRCNASNRELGSLLTPHELITTTQNYKNIKKCSNNLKEELDDFNHKVVIALGPVGLYSIMSKKDTYLRKYRGTITNKDGIRYLSTYNPLYNQLYKRINKYLLLRNYKTIQIEDLVILDTMANMKHVKEFMSDLLKIKHILDGAITVTTSTYINVNDLQHTKEYLLKVKNTLLKARELVFDFEVDTNLNSDTTGFKEGDCLLGCGFSWAEGKSIFIPLDHTASPFRDGELNLIAHSVVKDVLLSNIPKIAHNGIFDCYCAYHFYDGLRVNNFVFDTMLAHHLLDPTKETHNLKYLASTFTDLGGYEDDIKGELGLDGPSASYGNVDLNKLGKYCMIDCDTTMRLKNIFTRRLNKSDLLLNLWNKIVMPSHEMIFNLKLRGWTVDEDHLYALEDHYASAIAESLATIAENKYVKWYKDNYGVELNINSPKQLAKLFYDDLKIAPKLVYKQKPRSVDKETLGWMLSVDNKDLHELVENLLKLRTYTKLQSTYIEGFHKYIVNNKIFTDYLLIGTETSRLSCVKGDTKVCTDKGFKEIKDIKVGDLVFTHKNRYRKVLKEIFKGYDIMYDVVLNNGNTLTCTQDHKILLKNGTWRSIKDIKDGSIKKLDTGSGKYTKGFRGLFRSFFTVNNRTNSKKTKFYTSKCKLYFTDTFVKKTIQSYKVDEILDFKIGRKESNAQQKWRKTSQLARRLCGWLRIFKTGTQWEAAVCTSNSYGETFGTRRTPKFVDCASYRQQPIKQFDKQSSTNDDYGTQNYPLLAGDIEKKDVSIKKINIKGIYGVYDLTVDEDHSYLAAGIFSHNSVRPNLQNIPAEYDTKDPNDKIKSIFVAPAGYKLLSIDYSQIELRIMANLTKDPTMIKTFLDKKDPHMITAQHIFGRENITQHERKLGKTVNFAMAYGAGYKKLAQTAIRDGIISETEAKEALISIKRTEGVADDFDRIVANLDFYQTLEALMSIIVTKFYETYPKIKAWQKRSRTFTSHTGFCTTPFGRTRYFNVGLYSPSYGSNLIYNACINTPIQSTAHDCLLLSMCKIDKIQSKYFKSYLIGQVHDSAMLYIKDDELDCQLKLLKSVFINEPLTFNRGFFAVPLDAAIELGDNWAAAEEYTDPIEIIDYDTTYPI